ncbi:hypothetical protein IWW34DRAFT_381870 [Fusarium oxysporum f. sp. albedinis]|nr:hypothetical protein IWW34DRAFT_381870 [Fusarium oxysporum f. sp. albedinis]
MVAGGGMCHVPSHPSLSSLRGLATGLRFCQSALVDLLKYLEWPRPTQLCFWQKCPQQKDDNNCGIFTLAVLQALLNGNSIPSEVDAHHLRSFFAEQLEGTAGLDIVKPSSEAVFPGMPPISRRASLSRAIPTPTTLADLTTLESMTLHSPPELLTRICKEFGKNKSQPERRYKSP